MGIQRSLILLSAPLGFGKTTLLSTWLSQSTVPAAWLSLDTNDNDPVRFWEYVLAALEPMVPEVSTMASNMLRVLQPSSMETFLTVLLNALTPPPHDIALIFDDYHVITNQFIHDALAFLLAHLPPTLHLVLASRTDPPLPFARLRVQGQVTELRTDDLRFTQNETMSFFDQAMLRLSREDVTIVEAQTEGWVAALHLVALSLQRREDSANFLKTLTGSRHYIVDYLTEEVVLRLPESVQTFLQQTSLLDQLSGSLSNAITGRNDGQQMLEQLERDNLFVLPLDDLHHWYRYHPLFAEVLRTSLVRLHPDQLSKLHGLAAGWYAQQGFATNAVKHALAAPDFVQAAHIIEPVAQAMLMSGEVTTLVEWLDALPNQLVRSRPRLCLSYAGVLFTREHLEAAEVYLCDAENTLSFHVTDSRSSENIAEMQGMLGEIAAMRARIALMRGDASQSILYAQQAMTCTPKHDLYWRSVIAANLGNAYWLRGNAEEARQCFVEASLLSQTGGNLPMTITSMSSLAHLFMTQGQLHQAAEIYQQALERATDKGKRPLPKAGLIYIGLGELLREWNDLDAAAHRLQEGIELGKQWGNTRLLLHGYVTFARVKQAQGDWESALLLFQQAEHLSQHHAARSVNSTDVVVRKVQLWLAQGNTDAALQWMRGSELAKENTGDSRQKTEVYLIQVRVLLAYDDTRKALWVLDQLLQEVQRMGQKRQEVEVQILRVLAFQKQGESVHAMELLREAVAFAQPEGYMRVFVDEGGPIAMLLSMLLATFQEESSEPCQALRSYITHILAAIEGNRDQRHAENVARGGVSKLPTSPLSKREGEVLRLIALGLSNRQIAQTLTVTIGTVKKHLNNIFSKLHVHTRVQALVQARAQRLLPQ